jgi:hypothetical protein
MGKIAKQNDPEADRVLPDKRRVALERPIASQRALSIKRTLGGMMIGKLGMLVPRLQRRLRVKTNWGTCTY